MTTGFLYDPRFLRHETGKAHPECPERLSVTLKYLETLPWFSKLKNLEPEEAAEDWIRAVHSPEYIRRAEEVCRGGHPYLDTFDVEVCHESFDIAKLAAGGTLKLADQMMSGNIQNGFAHLR